MLIPSNPVPIYQLAANILDRHNVGLQSLCTLGGLAFAHA
jgi:hypothetical protein